MVLAAGATAVAQAPSIRGRVTSPTGDPIGDVAVTLVDLATGVTAAALTDGDGRFAFETQPTGSGTAGGRYRLAFEKAGFEPVVRSDLVASSADVNVVLQPGRIQEFVSVVGDRRPPSTSTKLDVAPRDVPLTVNTIDGETLQEQGTPNLTAAVRNVSGASAWVRYGAYMSFTVRGFNTEGASANVMVLTDGIRNEGGRIASQLTNIERIEVLKGPSAVLYGNDGLAGAINLIRKRPSAAPAYDFSMTAGSFDTFRTTAGATGAVGASSLLYRVDVGAEHADNWRDAGTRRVNVTPSLYWTPTGRDSLTAHVSFDRDGFDTDAGFPLLDGRTVPDVPMSRRFNTPQDFALSKDTNLQLRYVRAMSGAVQLRNVTSYRLFDIEYLSAETMRAVSPGIVNRQFLYFGSHVRPLLNQAEAQINYRLFGRESHVLGGWEFQRYDSTGDRAAAASTATTTIDMFNPVETHVTRPIELSGYGVFRNTVNALYVQNHTSLHDRVKLLVGGRFDVFRRWNRTDTIVGGARVEGPLTRRETDAFSPRAGLVVQPSSWMSVYGSYGESFTPINTIPHDGRGLEPERGRQYEVGQRFDLYGQRLSLTTAVYHLTRFNTPLTIASTPTGPIIEQAGEQRSRGVEVDLVGRLSERWRATMNYGFADSSYLSLSSGGVDLSGRRTAFAPRHTANVWATYDFPSGVGVGGGPRVVSGRFTNFFNDVAVDGYTIWDAAVFFRREIWDLAVNVNNVFDEDRYFLGAIYNTQLNPGPPMNAFVTLRVRVR